ncbi:MAG: septum formation initiator family protein [Lachnospiraceae bacterium]|nr:septum formation initiator family protein [Lachnospiraceae bacterium]
MAKKRKRQKKMTGFGLLVILTVVLCGVVLWGTAGLRKSRDEKLARQQQLQAQIDEQRLRSERLDIRRDYTGTKKFVEEMARKVLGLVYPDEILFEENQEGQ